MAYTDGLTETVSAVGVVVGPVTVNNPVGAAARRSEFGRLATLLIAVVKVTTELVAEVIEIPCAAGAVPFATPGNDKLETERFNGACAAATVNWN